MVLPLNPNRSLDNNVSGILVFVLFPNIFFPKSLYYPNNICTFAMLEPAKPLNDAQMSLQMRAMESALSHCRMQQALCKCAGRFLQSRHYQGVSPCNGGFLYSQLFQKGTC